MKKALIFFYVGLAIFFIALAYNTFNNKNKTDMKRIVNTSNAPKPIGPYNQAIKSKGILYLSGQIPLTPSMDLIENDIEKEVRQVMENLNEVLKAASMEFDNVVKATIYLNNMDDFSKVNSILSTRLIL